MSGLLSSLPLQTTGQVGVEFRGPGSCGGRECAHNEHGRTRQRREVLPDQVTKAALHAIADNGVAHGPADHEPHSRWLVTAGHPQVGDQRARRRTAPVSARPPERFGIGEALCRGYHCRADRGHRPGRGARLRRRGSCGPCGGGWRGSPGPRGCACAGGSRAPCAGGGCSAGTYACSRNFLSSTESMRGPRAKSVPAQKFGRHRPPTDHDSHGHAAPVDTGRPANGTRWRETGSNSRRPGRRTAVATCGELLAGAVLRGLGSPQPRFPAITGSPQSEPACDPHHTSGKWAPDLRKHRTGRRSDETRKGSFHSL
jgi:hypothetical protein